jgi:signal transduction histidine kinase
LAAGVLGARLFGELHRWLAGTLLGQQTEPPPRIRPAPGPLGWIRSGLTDASGWRTLLYLFARLPLTVLEVGVGFACWWYGLYFVTLPLSWRALPTTASYSWPRVAALTVVGAGLLLIAPWATRAVLVPDRLLRSGLLGPTRMARLRQSRALAVDDSAAALRRIERDLHDGAQAQLVALAMKLGLAREELHDGDTDAALVLVDTAHEGAKVALTELRDLVRGIHPPALSAGLAPALETLAARSAVPVRLHIELPDRPSPAIETIAYFSATELLANVAKHSGARCASLSLTAERPGWLRLVVRDDGAGGARAAGGGLTGLADRARTVDGTLVVDSPPGGPTVVRMDLPVRA